MAVIKISNGKKLCWYPGEILPEREEIDPQLLLSELSEQDFPLEIVNVTEKQDCVITQKFEIRVTKKGGLAMHHMGMNVKRKSVDVVGDNTNNGGSKTPSPAPPVLRSETSSSTLKTGGEL